MKYKLCKICKFKHNKDILGKICIKCDGSVPPLCCSECRYDSLIIWERGYNCVGDKTFVACEDFQWD